VDYELARIAVALAGTAYLAWEDARTSFMNERVLYAMIGVGLLLDLATLQTQFIIFSVGGSALIFAVGYYLYRSGQLGGGDVLLISSLQLLLPYSPQLIRSITVPALLPGLDLQQSLYLGLVNNSIPFVASVFITGTLLALLGSSVHFARKLRGRKLKPDYLVGGLTFAVAAAIVLMGVFVTGITAGQWVLFIGAFIPAIFLASFRKQINEELIVKYITISEIQDEDVLMVDEMDPRIVKKYGLSKVLTVSEVEKLRKVSREKKIRKFPVAVDLPRFGPYLLAGLVASLALGDLVSLLLIP
jgi:hypothetical protein